MALYDDVVEFLAKVENPAESRMNSRDRFSQSQVDEMVAEHGNVPEDFLAYLREVGAGNFRECQFKVYSFLGTPDEILGEGVLLLDDPSLHILCFGDNFSGDLSGFLPDENWAVVELWHDSGTIYRVNKSFAQYIREMMLMTEDGSDMRES
jgi:hypothetical protein